MKNWLAFLILLSVFFVIYHSALSIFFRQDEWLGFGSMIGYGMQSILLREPNSAAHFVPITLSIDYLLFKYLHLNYIVYNLIGLGLHLTNGFLVYFITKEILEKNKNKNRYNGLLALLAGVFFISSSVAVQLILWTVISINSLSLAISLLVFLFLLKYERFHSPLKFGILISVLILLAFLILEYSVGLLIFVPVALFIYKGNSPKGEFKKIISPIIFVMSTYVLIRLFFLLQSTGSSVPSNVSSLFQKIAEFPLRLVGQIIFPQKVNIYLSNLMVDIPDSLIGQKVLPENLRLYLSDIVADHPNMAENLLFKIFAILSSVIFFYLLYRLINYVRFKQKEKLKDLLVVLLFLIASVFPFIVIPGQDNDFRIFPSRYLYFGLAGYSILLAIVVKVLADSGKRLLFGMSLALILVNIAYGTVDNWQEINAVYKEGQTRLGILNSIKNSYPKLSEKVVFFSESDSSFYGLPEKDRILPFQSGFGQTLLVWYQLSENFPKEFFQNKFLWEIKDQGYAEFNGRGFGYFRDFSSLGKVMQDKELPLESALSFRFESGQDSIQDITGEVQGRVAGYMADKRVVEKTNLVVSASNNSQDAWLAVDGDRDSAWDSKLPYDRPQYFEIDLSKAMTIAQITIDTYNNVNQNQVGFAVSLSSDGKTWKDVFYAKRYPPNEKGLINIYFKPQLARFVKIEQKGNHAYANWVIHDLKIYEADS